MEVIRFFRFLFLHAWGEGGEGGATPSFSSLFRCEGRGTVKNVCCEALLGESLGGTASSADLGGSSKYPSEKLEDRSGEWFHGNSICPWVSRS